MCCPSERIRPKPRYRIARAGTLSEFAMTAGAPTSLFARATLFDLFARMRKPLILVSNDDGITSKGILTLVNIMKELGEVIVVAPDSRQSGMVHAITVGESFRLEENFIFEGVKAYECSGTPADCVKIARHFVLKGQRQPDVVVSGVNHGSNTSIS